MMILLFKCAPLTEQKYHNETLVFRIYRHDSEDRIHICDGMMKTLTTILTVDDCIRHIPNNKLEVESANTSTPLVPIARTTITPKLQPVETPGRYKTLAVLTFSKSLGPNNTRIHYSKPMRDTKNILNYEGVKSSYLLQWTQVPRENSQNGKEEFVLDKISLKRVTHKRCGDVVYYICGKVEKNAKFSRKMGGPLIYSQYQIGVFSHFEVKPRFIRLIFVWLRPISNGQLIYKKKVEISEANVLSVDFPILFGILMLTITK